MERWKKVPYYEGRYEASTYGRVRNSITEECITPYRINPDDDHLTVNLMMNGKQNAIGLHRVIATTFVPNYGMKNVVHHKDFNPLNNRPDNLMWVSNSYNIALGNGRKGYTVHVYRHGSELLHTFRTKTDFVKSLGIQGDNKTVWNRVLPYLTKEGDMTYGLSETTVNWLKSDSFKKFYDKYISEVKTSNGANRAGKGATQAWVNSLSVDELAELKADTDLSRAKFKAKWSKDKRQVVKALQELEAKQSA